MPPARQNAHARLVGKPMQALVAIIRKLLLAIWGMFKKGEKWDGSKFYKIVETA